MLFSVIIPVFGQWQLTKNCLIALKREIDLPFEVILIDNGAAVLEDDLTRIEAPILGKELFQDNFVYLPQKENLNFGGASNLGAKVAKAPLLFFLNNDTIVMKNFLAPLLEEFQNNSEKIMVGPLLLFPPKGSVNYSEHIEKDFSAYSIQHIGVYFTPQLTIGHLYLKFPANHRVTKIRKEFQCITGAAFFMRKEDFWELNGFDEKFRNGFEDVDLCLRFKQIGGRMFVNPKSKIVHLCSQTPGRSRYKAENTEYFNQKIKSYNVQHDYHTLLELDEYELHINEWIDYKQRLTPKLEARYEPLLTENKFEKIKRAFLSEPIWEKGFYALINHPQITIAEVLELYYYKLNIVFDFAEFLIYVKLLEIHEPSLGYSTKSGLIPLFTKSTDKRLNVCKSLMAIKNLPDYFYKEIQEIINEHDNFMQTTYIKTLTEIKALLNSQCLSAAAVNTD